MAAILWADVTDLAKELATGVPVGGQTKILALVNGKIDLDGEDGELTKDARVYFAAHLGTLAKAAGGAIGAVIAQAAGGLSRAYASNSPVGTDPLLDKTSYGQTFRLLCRLSPTRGPRIV